MQTIKVTWKRGTKRRILFDRMIRRVDGFEDRKSLAWLYWSGSYIEWNEIDRIAIDSDDGSGFVRWVLGGWVVWRVDRQG